MRIGMMADIYRPHTSGVTNYISLNKRVLEARGHEVFVFTFGDVGYVDDESRIIRSPGVPVAETGFHLSFRHSRAARRQLQSMDIVHVHHPFLSGRLALRYCRPRSIPIIFTNHTRYDLYMDAYLPMLPDQLGTTFLQAYLQSFCREVDLTIAPSEGLRAVLRELGITQNVEVIPNGVDLQPFEPDVVGLPREALGVPEGDVLLVYVGRLSPEKNLTFLLRAFAGAQAAYPDTSLLLVGDGPEADNLEDLAQRSGVGAKVIFTGMVEYKDLPRYLAAADIFVTASVTEVHPLTLIEALAAGLPVLGVRSPGVSDTIEDGVNGLLSPNDLASYSALLSRLIGDTDLRRRLQSQARPSAQPYSVERTASRVEDLYARLLADRDRPTASPLRMLWNSLQERWS
jgi:glycosyltransferase involved in cell wall biosynthesis